MDQVGKMVLVYCSKSPPDRPSIQTLIKLMQVCGVALLVIKMLMRKLSLAVKIFYISEFNIYIHKLPVVNYLSGNCRRAN